jgi:hypothetical protein
LIHLLGNPVEAERMGRYGFGLVNNVFSWEKVVERMGPYLEAAARGLKQPASSISTTLVGAGVS